VKTDAPVGLLSALYQPRSDVKRGRRRVGSEERVDFLMTRQFPTVEFSAEQILNCETLFPPEIDRDPWVFYHATTSFAEPIIDSEGLRWQPGVCSRSEIEEIVNTFEAMNWAGLSCGGLAVLKPFSLQGDFGDQSSKPIYFREFSLRSLVDAKRDFAGGESARGVRHAMRDLHEYLSNVDVREHHYNHQRHACLSLLREGAIPGRVIRVRHEWLKRRCDQLETLYARCQEIERSYIHGVVYAVRFRPEELPWLSYCDWMGLRCFRPVPCAQIVGKARILVTDFEDPPELNRLAAKENDWRTEDPHGLLAELEVHGGYTDHKKVLPTRRINQNDLEPAGDDDALDLAVQYGTPAIVAYLRLQRG
jgi:hypothetical protein